MISYVIIVEAKNASVNISNWLKRYQAQSYHNFKLGTCFFLDLEPDLRTENEWMIHSHTCDEVEYNGDALNNYVSLHEAGIVIQLYALMS